MLQKHARRHIIPIDSLEYGFAVDLQDLARQGAEQGCSGPTRDEWELLASADAASAADVTRNAKVMYAELLKSFVPAARRRLAKCETAEDTTTLRAWSVVREGDVVRGAAARWPAADVVVEVGGDDHDARDEQCRVI